jgi:hypothetical protein
VNIASRDRMVREKAAGWMLLAGPFQSIFAPGSFTIPSLCSCFVADHVFLCHRADRRGIHLDEVLIYH